MSFNFKFKPVENGGQNRFKLGLDDGYIEIGGTEEFVSETLDNLLSSPSFVFKLLQAYMHLEPPDKERFDAIFGLSAWPDSLLKNLEG